MTVVDAAGLRPEPAIVADRCDFDRQHAVPVACCHGARLSVVVAVLLGAVLAACDSAEPALAPAVTPDQVRAIAWEPDLDVIVEPEFELEAVTEERLEELQQECRRLERESAPAQGVSRAALEARFGPGEALPLVPSKLPQEAPPDSPRRQYAFLEDAVLCVGYDDDWNVSRAYFHNPRGRKATRAGLKVPLETRAASQLARIAWIERVRDEMRTRFSK